MTRAAKHIRTVLFPAVAAALAFGASQAMAVPAAQPAEAALACVDESCDGACVAKGYDFGVCNPGCTCYPRP